MCSTFKFCWPNGLILLAVSSHWSVSQYCTALLNTTLHRFCSTARLLRLSGSNHDH